MQQSKISILAIALTAIVGLLGFSLAQGGEGNLEWARQASGGGTIGDWGNGIAVDAAGNSYVTGLFVGTATFGTGEANETVLVSAGIGDLFIAKYDTAGSVQWAKRAGGASGDQGTEIAVDEAGNSYVTGSFSDTATFGAKEANETILTSAGGQDIFVAKYDSSGALVWAKWAGGSESNAGQSVAVDGTGNNYVTGRFVGTATFGVGEANETVLISAGGSDVFITKYDTAGNLQWAKKAGGTSNDSGSGIAVDGSGNSYVTGGHQSTATLFGVGEANETVLTSEGVNDLFVAKYDTSGALLWAKKAGGTSNDFGSGIAVDGSGNNYVTGQLSMAERKCAR